MTVALSAIAGFVIGFLAIIGLQFAGLAIQKTIEKELRDKTP